MLRRRRRNAAPADRAAVAVPIAVRAADERTASESGGTPGGSDGDVIDVDRYGALMAAVLAAEGVEGPGEANLYFVDANAIAQLNALHLHGGGPTDVLSFPIDAHEPMIGVEERMVGDVVVCPSVAAAGAADHAGTFADELALLVVHGTLHLVGHDHDVDERREVMWARERELVAAHWGQFTRDPWA